MRIYMKFSSRLVADLYQDTCHEGYREMILGLVEILDKFSNILELDDYHSLLSKLSFCYYYSEEWDSETERTIYLRESYVDLWQRVIKSTDTLLDIWPQILCRRQTDDATEYFGYCDHLQIISILTR